MFQRILVPVDLSDRNDRAVATAAALALDHAGTVCLFHVIETLIGLDPEDEAEFFRQLEERARAILERHGERLQAAGVDWTSEVVYGSRAREIVRKAADMEADLVVMTSHAVDPDDPKAGWGTLSYQVAVLTDRPVLLLK